jgi:glycerol-3-phosphate acyltransferase PlsY
MSGTFLLLLILAYLLGSIPFGKLVGKQHGIDIQKHGSGNIGFANVQRNLGWGPGLIVLAGDILKGFIPVLIAEHYLPAYQVFTVGVVAVAGHIFPPWLKFRGGKGIATGFGVTLALNPVFGLIAAVIYLVALSYFRKSGPSSIAASWSLPLLCLFFSPKYAWLYFALALLATWTHRTNLKALRKITVNAD